MNPAPADGYQPRFESRFLSPRFWPAWLGMGLLRLCVWLPRPLVAGLGALLGELFYVANAKRRRIVAANLALCFPSMPEADRRRMAHEHFRRYVQCLLDLGLMWWGRPAFIRRYVKIRGLEHLQSALAANRPVILLTGHFVAIDIGGIALSQHATIIGLIKRARNPLVDWLVCRGRARFRSRLFLRAQGLRPVVRYLKQGEVFYYVPDQDHGPERSVFAPFLGTTAATITAPGRLAAMAEALVVPCYTRRISARAGYEVVLQPPLEHFPSGDVLADTTRLNRAIEAGVQAAPAQYMWTLKFFKTRPPGETPPY